MQIAFRIAPGLATLASRVRQRTPQATQRRSRRKAERGFGPWAKQLSGHSGSWQAERDGRSSGSQHWQGPGRHSGSQAEPTGRSSGSQHWQAPGRSSGSWWESSQWDEGSSWTGGSSWAEQGEKLADRAARSRRQSILI